MSKNFRNLGHDAMVTPMPLDRRSRARKPDAPCPACRVGPQHVRVTNRTSFRLFYKCTQCGNVWNVEVPRRAQVKGVNQPKLAARSRRSLKM